jgi:hypothetical protein
MEHGERIESGDTRESGEGAEEERGAGSDEREAMVGSEREVGGLTGAIKKKKPKRRRREGRRAPSLRSSGKTQHDRAGHARHEGPVLPSRV